MLTNSESLRSKPVKKPSQRKVSQRMRARKVGFTVLKIHNLRSFPESLTGTTEPTTDLSLTMNVKQRLFGMSQPAVLRSRNHLIPCMCNRMPNIKISLVLPFLCSVNFMGILQSNPKRPFPKVSQPHNESYSPFTMPTVLLWYSNLVS